MGAKRIRRSTEEWRRIFARQVASGLSVDAFCQREGVARSAFTRWRSRLAASVPMPRRGGLRPGPAPFIEVGELSSAPVIRLDLGAGIVLTIRR